MAGGQEGPWCLQLFRKTQMFGHFNVSSENFRTFVVGKDIGFEFYGKILGFGFPTLKVPRRPWAPKLEGSRTGSIKLILKL